jgi:acyl-CoA synthetase (AMP-forming)/AMP-acid ligase II
MLSKKKSSVYQNKSSSQHCALRGSDANFELIDNNLRNVATRLASYKDPESLRVLDELPRDALSKIGT